MRNPLGKGPATNQRKNVVKLIIQSFIQSFVVFAKMIFPVIGVFLASIIFWLVANIFTLGLASYVSAPITAAFIALLGIRVALSLNGAEGQSDIKFLGLYGAAYGIVLMLGKAALVFAATLIALLATEWNLSELGSFRSLANAERAVQTAFVLHAISIKAILSVVFLAAVPAAMAVPMAAAAQNSGVGIVDRGFFQGFGSRFLPLYLICLVTYVPQFVLGIISSFFGAIATMVALFGILNGSLEITSAQIEVLLKGFGALAALLWLNSWVWAASALAFVSYAKAVPQKVAKSQSAPKPEKVDLRALRKKRADF